MNGWPNWSNRLASCCIFILPTIVIAQRAAHVVKADLATRMVVEMTALQGIMGREYALKGDYPPEVADAIFEHWLPRSADDMLPTSPAGTLLALADRLDSLVGLFGVGLAPKSTADPYGLRRAALGIIQILVQKEIDLSLGKAVELTIQVQPVRVQANTKDDVLDFIAGRLRAWVEEQEWPRDVIAAVLAEQSANPYRAMVGIRQLSEWVQSPNWEQILDGFARCVRITRAESQRYGVDPDMFTEGQEKHLYSVYSEALSHLETESNVNGFLSCLRADAARYQRLLQQCDGERGKRGLAEKPSRPAARHQRHAGWSGGFELPEWVLGIRHRFSLNVTTKSPDKMYRGFLFLPWFLPQMMASTTVLHSHQA